MSRNLQPYFQAILMDIPVELNPRTELPRGVFDWTTKDTLIGDRGG